MKTLLTKEQLHEGVVRMAGAITACYESRPLTVVGVLTVMFAIATGLLVGTAIAQSVRGTLRRWSRRRGRS